jgi:hypothetical protein
MIRRLLVAAGVASAASAASGCADCGDLVYGGIEVFEQCGVVYGTQGTWFRGDGVVELRIGASTSPSREHITFRPDLDVRLAFPDRYLARGADVPPEDLATRCRIARGAPASGGPAPTIDGPADEAAVTVLRRGINPDPNPIDRARYRRFSWRIACGDGVLVSDATDVVELTVVDGASTWPPFGPTDADGDGDGS